MAIATGLAVSSAALSGVAVGAALSVLQLGRRQAEYDEDARQEESKALVQQLQLQQQQQQQVQNFPGGQLQPAEASRARTHSTSRAEGFDEDPMTWEGFTMEEAREHLEVMASRAENRTPASILAEMQRGNTRFWMGQATRPEKSAFQRRALISRQFPKVAILGCSDSRVPTEIVFDQGLGDIFVIRIAGNGLEPSSLASVQYAVHHLKVKLVVVLGHEACGAVKAAQLPSKMLAQEPMELQRVLEGIKMGLDEDVLGVVNDARAHDREAVTTNVKRQVEKLTRDAGIMSKVMDDELIVIGSFYEISSGIVDFFFEVSQSNQESAAPHIGVASRFKPDEAGPSGHQRAPSAGGTEVRRIPSGGLDLRNWNTVQSVS